MHRRLLEAIFFPAKSKSKVKKSELVSAVNTGERGEKTRALSARVKKSKSVSLKKMRGAGEDKKLDSNGFHSASA